MSIRILYLLLVVLPLCSHAQETELSAKYLRKQRPSYLQVGLGANRGSVRDFATSPITYRGLLLTVGTGYLRMDTARETKLTARVNIGSYSYKRTEGIDVRSSAGQYYLFLNYARLYQLNKLSGERWNFKIGGMADVATSERYNEDLMNAALGYELFNTIFLSGKLTRRFERTETIQKQFLFIKYKLKPRVTLLSYQLNLPVMNNTVRNGFAYIANEGINTTPLFKEYEAKAFSGTRFSSELALTNVMDNGNMWRLSYIWDAYLSGKAHSRFEMAHHIVEFSLLFHLNKNGRQ